MAKKDNFDFETESKPKSGISFDFLKNLTQKQKGIIIAAVVGIVLVIAIVVTIILIGANNNNSGNGGNEANVNNPGNSENDDENNNEMPEEITKFYISALPSKTEFTVGDPIDFSGLTVYVKSAEDESLYISYDDDPDAFIITGFDSSAPAEEQVITVECRGFTDTFTIKILEKDTGTARLVGITIDPLPQTTYKVGESFNTTGGYIVCEYSDGTFKTEAITMKNIFGFGAIAYTPGEHQIKIKYSDDKGGYAETYITVIIVEE